MKTILFFLPSRGHATLAKYSGLCRAAKPHGWRVQTVDAVRGSFGDIRRVLDFWKPAGAVVDCGGLAKPPRPADFGTTPVVFLGAFPKEGRVIFSVNGNLREDAYMAARELLQPNRACYAFVGSQEPRSWSRERCRHFQEAIELHGKRFFAFSRTIGARFDALRWESALKAWLLALPRPCGLFAANDITAAHVLGACLSAHLKVPDDIAILGVNNDEHICLNSHPHLSSILPDFESSGALAARLLSARLHSPNMKPAQRTFPPLMVVRRASTRERMPYDQDVSRALETIREKACAGLRAHEVASGMRGSRRLAEMHFRKATGHSILDEIQAVRMAYARELLVNSKRPVKVVAQMCGYASENSFRRIYRNTFGVSPRA